MFSFMDVPDLSDEMSSVIPAILYISGYKPASNESLLRDYEIRKVVRLGDLEDFQNTYQTFESIEYHDIVIRDSVKSHFTPEMFNECIDFIGGGPALVHCYAGISRSATVVMAYLIKRHRMGVKEARLHLKSTRSSISPNSTFQKDLIHYFSLSGACSN